MVQYAAKGPQVVSSVEQIKFNNARVLESVEKSLNLTLTSES